MPQGHTPLVAVVGSINMDLSFAAPRVPLRGENLPAHSLRIGLGGKGANPAVALARMGAEAALVACVGQDDFGQQALKALAREGVDHKGVAMLPDIETGVALIMVDDEGENTILVVAGANVHLTPEQVARSLDTMPIPDAIEVNFEITAAAVRAAIDWASAHGVPVVVDAGPARGYGPEVWHGATYVSPNEAEAEAMTGIEITDESSALQAAQSLLDAGVTGVALKLGGRGSLCIDARGVAHIPPFRVDVVDTTGAGDAFTAGLTRCLALGMSLPEATRFGNAAGAVAVTRMGALETMPRLEEVEALLAGD